jgi:chemotaxis protein histidine kinase CheA
MAEDQLRTLIDVARTRLHDELEVQLGAMAATQTLAVEQARKAAETEAEQKWAAQLEALRHEGTARLESEVATLKAEADRTLIAETTRARSEAQQAAAESAAAARRELEESVAAERQRLEAQLAAERRRVSEIEVDQQRTAAELNAQRQHVSELEAERRGVSEQQAERERTLAALTAERDQARAQLDSERQRLAELDAERQRLAGDLATARDQAQGQLDAERQRAAAELQNARSQAEIELEAERQRGARALSEARVAAAEADRTRTAALPLVDEGESSSRLVDAIRLLDEAANLTDLLAAAVRGAAAEASRAAIFIIQGTELREWPVAGVPSVDSGPLRIDGREAGVIAEALRRNQPAQTGGPDGAAAPFFASLGPDKVAVAVPLVLEGIPVAVLYADQGGNGQVAASWQDHIQILGRHAAACAASLTAVRTAQAMRFVSSPSPQASAASGNGHDDVQAARRYARLLVSEIKLYNETAVRMGRERRDLLVRLEPEIQRARRLYDERVATSVDGRDTVFQQELAQTLADGDPSLLGAGPQQPSL